MVNGERSDCLLADVVVTGNKRRSQCGSAETRKDVEVADKAAPPQQVWGLDGDGPAGLAPRPHCHVLSSILLITQLPQNSLGSSDQICIQSSR